LTAENIRTERNEQKLPTACQNTAKYAKFDSDCTGLNSKLEENKRKMKDRN
jgi:hypothetical protein